MRDPGADWCLSEERRAYVGGYALIAIVALWWSWPFVWIYPLWRARWDDTRAWWTSLLLSLLLLGLASPAILFVSMMLAGAKT